MASCEVEKEYVTVEEAATMLGVHYDTVVKMLDDGRLAYYRTSEPRGKRMISVVSIRALAEPTVASDEATDGSEEDDR